MMAEASPLVSQVRSASRDLVREFGFMKQTFAGTDFSASTVHAIIEIGNADGLMSKTLCDKLLLKKSTVSRLVKSLVHKQEIREVRSEADTRKKHLYLTEQGRATLREIDHYAKNQVAVALDQLDEESQHQVLKGLQDYASALKVTSNRGDDVRLLNPVEIKSGYRSTLIARAIELLHSHMHKHHGFGVDFESRIAGDMAEFFTRINSPKNEAWRAEVNGEIVGSISIDGEDLGNGLAHLRWFVVSNRIRGGGIGKELLSKAVDFCDQQGFLETHLWTVKGLGAARNLYERQGFVLAEEYYGDQWGTKVLEQKFVRPYFG